VCDQFNEHRNSYNEKCHFFNDHFVPAADVVAVETVAQMFFDFTGDKFPCNFNDTDEWLPFYCEYEAAGKCPDPDEGDELACWKQYIKHYERRGEDG
jgi:hypothetical protein